MLSILEGSDAGVVEQGLVPRGVRHHCVRDHHGLGWASKRPIVVCSRIPHIG